MAIAVGPLADYARIFPGVMTRGSQGAFGRDGNVLSVRALTGDGIDFDLLETVEFDDRDVERYRVRAGDLLISARSTTLKTAIVPVELDQVVINATLIGVRCLEVLEPLLLRAWLHSGDGNAALAAVTQTGTAQMNVTVAGLSQLEVPVLPMEQQRQLASLISIAETAYHSATEAAEKRLQLAREVVAMTLKEHENGHH